MAKAADAPQIAVAPFSAEYYESKERQASGIPSSNSSKPRTLR
jgi:hypothetical protein